MSLYDKQTLVRVHVQNAEILSAAEDVLEEPDEETDQWLAEVIAERYSNLPRDVTIAKYMKHLDKLFRDACTKRRELINGYGGPVQPRA